MCPSSYLGLCHLLLVLTSIRLSRTRSCSSSARVCSKETSFHLRVVRKQSQKLAKGPLVREWKINWNRLRFSEGFSEIMRLMLSDVLFFS